MIDHFSVFVVNLCKLCYQNFTVVTLLRTYHN